MARTTGVKCTVDECTYWGAGDVCEAGTIEVNPNAPTASVAAKGGKGANMEAGRIGEKGVKTSRETMCKTFRPKPAAYER